MTLNSVHTVLQHRQREVRDGYMRTFQLTQHVTPDLVARLDLEKELEGHAGCVNCLEWNESGTLLVSGSDDYQVILWDPFRYRRLHTVQSGHQGNIFSVKFLPSCGDNTLVTCAADAMIRVHDLSAQEITHVCSCHSGRVKRLAVTPNIPYLVWSASEDGSVMQFDLRMSHQCHQDTQVLLSLISHIGRGAECKCIAVNPLRPEQVAVGANDPYIRLYDRRMITLTSKSVASEQASRVKHKFSKNICDVDDNLPPGCVQYFVPGHLPLRQHGSQRKSLRTLASTYVTFGPDGNELLANLGGEQIYIFSLNSPQRPAMFDLDSLMLEQNGFYKGACGGSSGIGRGLSNGYRNGAVTSQTLETKSSLATDYKKVVLSPRAEKLKLEANLCMEKQKYTPAIRLYNDAIRIQPSAAILYGNRAAAYMKRGWDGDIYAGMRDCHMALQLDPNHLKAHFRLARCLYELQWTREAADCLQTFKSKFPEHTHSHAYQALDKDIRTAVARHESDDDDERETESESSSSRRSSSATISSQEKVWRAQSYDYHTRFCGHCNTTTDIKEANFFGNNGQYIVAGSDDGSFFVWERATGNLVRILHGDESIVNCLQPHPSTCLLATSGIDPVVRLWSPRPQDGTQNERLVVDMEGAATANQKRMGTDPVVMLVNMGYRQMAANEPDVSSSREAHILPCRTS